MRSIIIIEFESELKLKINWFIADFRYWDDETDTTRDKEGTLLPLWEFMSEKIKNLEVTGICWNPTHNDLFGVSFGSCKL